MMDDLKAYGSNTRLVSTKRKEFRPRTLAVFLFRTQYGVQMLYVSAYRILLLMMDR
jgi:hypothetical protein